MRKKLLGGLLALSLVISLLFVPQNLFANAENSEVLAEYTQNFTDIESVQEDFDAFYTYTMGGSNEPDTIASNKESADRWYIENGVIRRTAKDDDISMDLNTDSIAALTFKRQKFVNFELSIDYKMGSQTYYWPVIAFRQSEKGKYFLEDGAGVFVQEGGNVTLWGTDGVGGPYAADAIPGYAAKAHDFHNMRVVVDGLDLNVYIDNSAAPIMKRKLPASFFKSGYISLISVNNDSEFKNLSIKELPISPIPTAPKPDPIPDAGTDDSLDNMATEGEIIEVPEGSDSKTYPAIKKPNAKSQNNVVFIVLTCVAGALILAEGAVVTIILIKKKKA